MLIHPLSSSCRKIQEEGLRTYLFTYAPHYSTLSLSHLASTFSLSLSTVTSIVSKLIWTEELAGASLDQVAGVVVLDQAATELSHLQRLAVQLVDKASQMADGSERYLDSKLQSSEQRADGVRGGPGAADSKEGGGSSGARERRGGGGRGRGGGGGSRGRGGAVRQFNSGSLGRTVKV